jgi:hypothetical protein
MRLRPQVISGGLQGSTITRVVNDEARQIIPLAVLLHINTKPKTQTEMEFHHEAS